MNQRLWISAWFRSVLSLWVLPSLVSSGITQSHPQYNCVVKNVTTTKTTAAAAGDSPSGLCHYCYTSWKEVVKLQGSTNVTQSIVAQQGCFNYEGPREAAEECLRSDCRNIVSPDDDSYRQGQRFCCCIGDFCNGQFTSEQLPDYDDGPHYHDVSVNQKATAGGGGESDSQLGGGGGLLPNWTWLTLGLCLGLVAFAVYAFLLAKALSHYKIVRLWPLPKDKADLEGGGGDLDLEPKVVIKKGDSLVVAQHQQQPSAMPLLQEDDLCRIINFADFSLDEKIRLGSGKFGSTLHRLPTSSNRSSGKSLSVKVFRREEKQGFYNEQDVYQTIGESSMDAKDKCNAFLQFFGTRQNVTLNDGSTHDFMIGLEHNSRGFLSEFLQCNTVSWDDLCKMLTTVSSGLSYLHSGFRRSSSSSSAAARQAKSFCHRDLNSRNILVRSDLSCCLCNFEKSSVIGGGGKPATTTTTMSSTSAAVLKGGAADESAENQLTEVVGTPRYLAPEVLEISCSSIAQATPVCLKQVDVYAMGLVFWELSRRCHDLYQGVPVPSFEFAFHQELGGGGGGKSNPSAVSNPTLDQMRILVSRRKARPLFPEVWKNSNPAIQRLRETMEDLWDNEGEARVTATCVLERGRELSSLWRQYHSKRQATLPTTNNIVNLQQGNCGAPSSSSANIKTDNLHRLPPSIVFESNRLGLRGGGDGAVISHDESHQRRTKNNNVLSRQQPAARLQPHQGRNPCLERNNLAGNLTTEDDQGAPLLVHGSIKDTNRRGHHRNVPLQVGGGDDDSFDDDDDYFDDWATPGGGQDRLVRSVAQPIPYLLNDFSSEGAAALPEEQRSSRWPLKGLPLFSKSSSASQQPPPPRTREPKSNNVNFERQQQQLQNMCGGRSDSAEQPSCSNPPPPSPPPSPST